jgi:AAA domain
MQAHFQVHHPILVCTYTNVAVDNLVEGLSLAGIRPLRVGYDGKVKISLLEHTLDYKLERHPYRPEIDRLTKMEETLQKRIHNLRTKVDNLTKDDVPLNQGRVKKAQLALISLEKQQNLLKSKIYTIRQKMLKHVVDEADVVRPLLY